MMVDMTSLATFDYPLSPSSLVPQGPPKVEPVAPAPPAPEQSVSPSSLDPNTASVMSLIQGMSESLLAQIQLSASTANSQFSELSQRLEHLEQPKPKSYSPSVQAALWQPARTSHPVLGQIDYGPWDELADDAGELYPDDENNASTWYYDDVPDVRLFHGGLSQPSNPSQPNWPDAFLKSIYLDRFNLPASATLTDTQCTEILALPGIYMIFCQCNHHPIDIPISHYEYASFWEFHDDYSTVKSQGCDPLANFPPLPPPTCMYPLEAPPPAPVPPLPQAQPQAPSGSINLFGNRAPSQPPIATINAPAPVTALTPVSAPEKPTHDPSLPWKVMGAGNKPHSFASAASSCPANTNPPPIKVTQRPACLSDVQLEAMMRNQIIHNYEVHFNATIRTCGTSKQSLIFAYKHAHSNEAASFVPAPAALTATSSSHSSSSSAPPATNHSRPRAHPISTTDFTILCDPSTIALQGPHGDPASLVRSLQTSLRQACPGGASLPFTLLSGHWSS